MSEYLIQEETLKSIADAIRGKTGKTELLNPHTMASEINDLDLRKLPILDSNFPKDVNLIFIRGNSVNVSFNVSIIEQGNPAEYTYQWYKDGVAIDGANSHIYSTSISNTVSHSIYCEIAHELGVINSRVASLNVTEYYTPTLKSGYPQDIITTIIKGDSMSATFSVPIEVEGVPATYTYQWYKDEAPIAGATNSTYTINNITDTIRHNIYCKVTNAAGSVNSRTALLDIVQCCVPTIQLGYPKDIEIVQFEDATFSVPIEVEGVPATYTYQWYKDGAPIAGATSSTYTKTDNTTIGTCNIYCTVKNIAGTVTSRTATLTIASCKPTYTYNGTSELVTENNKDWELSLKTGGSLNFSYLGNAKNGLEIFLVGGGGRGGNASWGGGGGGGGGYIINEIFTPIKDHNYQITIGGSAGSTQAFGFTANPGSNGAAGTNSEGYWSPGGTGTASGGSGGCATGTWSAAGGNGGDGKYAFDKTTGTRYGAGGGGGGGTSINEGEYVNYGGAGGNTGGGAGGRKGSGGSASTNTGSGGGGGGYFSGGGAGGSGIVIIRNKRG